MSIKVKIQLQQVIPISQCSPPKPFLHEHLATLSTTLQVPTLKQKFSVQLSFMQKRNNI